MLMSLLPPQGVSVMHGAQCPGAPLVTPRVEPVFASGWWQDMAATAAWCDWRGWARGPHSSSEHRAGSGVPAPPSGS